MSLLPQKLTNVSKGCWKVTPKLRLLSKLWKLHSCQLYYNWGNNGCTTYPQARLLRPKKVLAHALEEDHIEEGMNLYFQLDTDLRVLSLLLSIFYGTNSYSPNRWQGHINSVLDNIQFTEGEKNLVAAAVGVNKPSEKEEKEKSPKYKNSWFFKVFLED